MKRLPIKHILTLCLTCCFSIAVFAQQVTFKVKNVTVKTAVIKFKKVTGYSFVFGSNKVDTNKKISVNANNQPLKEVVNQILAGQNLDYEINGKFIIVKEKRKMEQKPLISPQNAKSQHIKASGRVTDTEGEPIIGATVMQKGTIKGTVTDVNGYYTLEVPIGSLVEISYVGYRKKVIQAGSNKNISLEEDTKALSEVIVVGFGTQKKETLTGAISSIKGEEMMLTNSATTSNALAGKIAGINSRQSDGRPGSSTTINIRGMGTPLYVIDGAVKDEGQFNNIDPNDIESISILKDASAAIYGMRAANGVVVVTTKSGQRNTPIKININTYYGCGNWFKFPKPADTKTYVWAKYQSDIIRHFQDSNYNMEWTNEEYKKWQEGTIKGYQGWDWYNYITKTAPMSYIEANVNGGSNNVNYYVSLSHLNQQATIRSYGGFYRTNMQMNIDANITSKFKIGANVNGRIEQRKHPGVPGGDDTWTAMYAIYRNLPTIRPYANDNPKYPQMTSSENSTNFAILNYATAGKFNDTWKVIQMNLTGEYDFLKELNLKGNVGYYYASDNLFNHEYTYNLYGYDANADTYYVSNSMANPWMERTYQTIEEVTGQFTVNYKQTFFNDHNIAFTIGGEFSRKKSPYLWIHDRPASNAIDAFHVNTLAEVTNYLDRPEARAGFLGRFNYDYKGKYLLELIGRRDGSWKYPPHQRWGFFPAVSAGWRISEENFWSRVHPIISNLKLKISYGIVGDDDEDNNYSYSAFDYLSGYNYSSGGAVIDGAYIIGTQPRGLPVTTISWMKAKMFNAGVEFGLLNNKLIGEINYFTRKIDGIPASKYDVLIPSEVGFSLPNQNLNSELTKGVDGNISYSGKVDDFKYNLGGNFTYSRLYEWQQYKPKYGNSWDYYRNSSWERYSNIAWGKQVIGQFQSWDQIANYSVDNDGRGNTTLRPGDFIYKDVNEDGVINSMDDRPIGYRQGATPYLNYNFNFNFAWKGFDLALTFTGADFASFLMEWEMVDPLHDGGNNPQYYLSNQWHLSNVNDPNSNLIPGKYPTVIGGNGSSSNYWTNDFWLLNVSYLKLRNLEFGYSLPSKILKRLGVTKARFYTSIQNLFCIDNLGDVDMDPEISTNSGLNYPTSRVISFGCNLTF